jgi:hypothetical protein
MPEYFSRSTILITARILRSTDLFPRRAEPRGSIGYCTPDKRGHSNAFDLCSRLRLGTELLGTTCEHLAAGAARCEMPITPLSIITAVRGTLWQHLCGVCVDFRFSFLTPVLAELGRSKEIDG